LLGGVLFVGGVLVVAFASPLGTLNGVDTPVLKAVGIFSFTPLFKVWSARMYDAFALPNATMVIGRACTRMLGAFLLVGVGLCVFVDDVIAILATSQYARSTAIVAPLVLGAFFSSAATLMDGAFYAERRTGLKPWIALVSMIVMCGLYAWLIPQYGAMGAACAILGGNAFLAAATWAVSQRVFHVQYEYGRVAAMLASAIATVLLAEHLDLGILNIPAKLALCAAWPVLLWTAGVVSNDEKAMVANGLRQVLRRFQSPLVAETAERDVPATSPSEVP